MQRVMAVFIVVISWVGMANAQTAEETVVFMLFGVEDNLEYTDIGGTQHIYRKVDSNKWTVVPIRDKDVPAKKLKASIVVVKQSNCRYGINLSPPFSSPTDYSHTLDFANLKNYRTTVSRYGERTFVTIDIEGDNLVYDPLSRSTEHRWEQMTYGGAATSTRLQKAAAYFRRTFCQGRAF